MDLKSFFERLKLCRGDVFFVSREKDRLNLSSMLTRMIFLTISKNEEIMASSRIECTDDGDYDVLKAFLEAGAEQ